MQMGRQINRSIVWTLALTIGCATAVVLALNSWLIYNVRRGKRSSAKPKRSAGR
jgi:hypothetical protein